MPDTPPNPDDLDRIDREIRLNEAWHEADEMARDQVNKEGLSGEKAEQAVECWRELYLYDTSPDTSEHEILRSEGIELPAADELDDAALNAKLWEVIRALAARNTFLHGTDHMSDRELYTHLLEEAFHHITKDIPKGSGWTYTIDIIGSGSDEDIELYLRYYADDDARARWAKNFPDHVMPAKEKRPHDRDRLLPQPKFE